MKEPMRVLESTKRAICVLDADCVATSTKELCDRLTHLNPVEMGQLKNLLKIIKIFLTLNLVPCVMHSYIWK